jgi:lysophospholipase L1-like esterase
MRKIIGSICLLLIFFQFSAYCQSKDDWPNLKKYAEADKELGQPAPGVNRVVFMGNSITEFWGKIDSSFFADNPYIDRGISGQTSPQMLLRFRQDVINLKPKAVAILAGTNDIAENTGPISLEDIFGNIVSMVQLADQNNIKVILCSVLPAYDFPWHKGLHPAEKIVKLNKMIKSYCVENNITYVDYYSKMADARGGMEQEYTKDGVHPNLAGYRVMEPLVVEAINKVLK